jgi:hypothetical protein
VGVDDVETGSEKPSSCRAIVSVATGTNLSANRRVCRVRVNVPDAGRTDTGRGMRPVESEKVGWAKHDTQPNPIITNKPMIFTVEEKVDRRKKKDSSLKEFF